MVQTVDLSPWASVFVQRLSGLAPAPQRALRHVMQLCYLPSSLELDLLMLPSRRSVQCRRCISGLITYDGGKFTPQSRNSFEVKLSISACEMLMTGDKKLIISLSFPGHLRKPSLVGVLEGGAVIVTSVMARGHLN